MLICSLRLSGQLVLMCVEQHTIIKSLAPTRSPFLGMLVSATMQASMVQLGTVSRSPHGLSARSLNGASSTRTSCSQVPRFYLNNLCQPPGHKAPWWHAPLAVALFLGATAMWAVCTASLIDYIGPLDAYTGDDHSEAVTMVVLAYAQVGYPLVSAVAWIWTHATAGTYGYNEFSPHLSVLKDVCYLSLDVSTKGGLALIAFLRATR